VTAKAQGMAVNAQADEFGDFSRVWSDIAQAFLE
tara:strand:- start:117 stop:218 length:102 start_codon:yes stop_codon:yes gene_type:complete